MATIRLLKGDCLQKLKELEDNSIDSVVTDPPYEIGFMGKGWDDSGIANNPELWKEVLRVLKPGGHLLSFSHSRTYHRQAVAVEDAGFEIRDQIMWIYGSGFPKSHDLGKNIEKIKVGGKANLTQVGTKKGLVATNNNDKAKTSNPSGFSYRTNNKGYSEVATDRTQVNGEIPVYEITNEYKGWGTALKPAHEPIVMARKPFKGTVADNVLEWGTGGINVDGCRVAYQSEADEKSSIPGSLNSNQKNSLFGMGEGHEHNTEGRFPANIIFDEEAGKILDEQSGISKSGKSTGLTPTKARSWKNSSKEGINRIGHNDEGGASRFFYCPKASKKDRNEGMPEQVPQFTGRPRREDGSVIYKETHPEEWAKAMEGKPRREKTSLAASEEILQPTLKGTMNTHPTVKPTDLMAYLIRLVTPKGGVVLDPFMGSGSTGKACVREGMNFIGIEREDEYMEIAKSRIEHEQKKNKHTLFFDI
jgi:DNA modification methylase